MLQDKERAFGQLLSLDSTSHCCNGLSSHGCRFLSSSLQDISTYGPFTNHPLCRLGCQRPDRHLPEYMIPPAEASQQHPYTHHHLLSSLLILPPHGSHPPAVGLLNSPPYSLHSIVYYFLYFVEKFLEPQDPGDFHRNNKFGEGLHALRSPSLPSSTPGSLWNSSSAVAPSCDLLLNSAACPREASQDTCYEYQPFFISTAVLWLWFSKRGLKWGVYRAMSKGSLFFARGVFYFFCKGSGP